VVILMTGRGSMETVMAATEGGAFEYLAKPFEMAHMIDTIKRAEKSLNGAEEEGESAAIDDLPDTEMIGSSPRMIEIYKTLSRVAPTDATVLVEGETGTGKELIAKGIHANSARSDQPFVAVNSGSVPADLLESALFGHVRGAFTGATTSRKGYFETANKGTIFFDEIGTISWETQAKLLRVIQEREFMPVGSAETIKVDVRIIAATNAELKRLVDEGKFREDLYYRLNVINLALPPLRDRKEDIPPLVDHFLTKFSRENEKYLDSEGKSLLKFEPDAMQLLMDYNWPGNVRELENAVERAVVLASQATVPVDVLPDSILQEGGVKIRRDESGALPADASLPEILADFERRKIIEALEAVNWSQTEAAEKLHIPLSTLNQKIKRLSIEIKRKGGAAG
jgi:DNA-binding NtrC family response regulator